VTELSTASSVGNLS